MKLYAENTEDVSSCASNLRGQMRRREIRELTSVSLPRRRRLQIRGDIFSIQVSGSFPRRCPLMWRSGQRQLCCQMNSCRPSAPSWGLFSSELGAIRSWDRHESENGGLPRNQIGRLSSGAIPGRQVMSDWILRNFQSCPDWRIRNYARGISRSTKRRRQFFFPAVFGNTAETLTKGAFRGIDALPPFPQDEPKGTSEWKSSRRDKRTSPLYDSRFSSNDRRERGWRESRKSSGWANVRVICEPRLERNISCRSPKGMFTHDKQTRRS